MIELPDPGYASAGDGTPIAYQVVGDGPVDVVVVHGMGGTIEVLWEMPGFGSWFERLSRRARLVMVEKRGHGISGGASVYPSLEVRSRDVLAVLDDLEIDRAALFGISEGSTMCTMLAAMRPERIAGLVLCGGFARLSATPDNEAGIDRDAFLDFVAAGISDWGTQRSIAAGLVSPRLADNAEWCRLWARMNRVALPPDAVVPAWELVLQMDIRDVLGSVRCPALVIHSTGDLIVPVALGRALAEDLPDARFVELDSDDHLPWMSDPTGVLDLVADFLDAIGPGPTHSGGVERMLATVLFTDIVGSTATATRLGDEGWRALLDDHDRIAAEQIRRHEGRLVKSTGDGMLAVFDGPGRAVGAATAIRDALQMIGIEIRTGVHTGEIELRGDDIGGVAVHIAARVNNAAQNGEIWATSTVRDLVAGSAIEFAHRGQRSLNGVDRDWDLYQITCGPGFRQ